jgi:hypothetical protein
MADINCETENMDDEINASFESIPSWAYRRTSMSEGGRRRSPIECTSIDISICATDIIATPKSTNGHVVYKILVTPVKPSIGDAPIQSWTIERRFNDFVFLDQCLRKHNPKAKYPNLPPKRFFGSSSEPKFVEERRLQLETYLIELVRIPLSWVKSDLAHFLDNECNRMMFIWNLERVAKMQEVRYFIFYGLHIYIGM